MNFIETEHGSVKIKHHSTSSLIEVLVDPKILKENNTLEKLWLTYYQFDDLQKAIEKANDRIDAKKLLENSIRNLNASIGIWQNIKLDNRDSKGNHDIEKRLECNRQTKAELELILQILNE